nr:hypothetical protein [Tanacetum cinerariifolium]
MDMTINQQVALDKALVPHASRLRIGKSNFCLKSDISSKESTLQLMYDVLLPGVYAVATGAAQPNTKASVRKTKSSFDTTVTPPTAAAGTGLSTSIKGKQLAKASKAKSLTVLSEVAMSEAKQIKLAMKRSLQQNHISQASGLGVDEGTGVIPGVPDVPIEEEEGQDEDDDEDELYRDVNINLEGRVVQILRDEAQAENEEFLKNLDENIQKIIKEQVKEQVKVQVSKILPKIEKTVNEKLEAEVLTRSSNSSKISYAVTANLSEMELKKILIEKIEGNKSIYRSDKQMNLYKALVKAYESDKIILDTYGDTVTLKRHRDDDADKDEEPFAGSDRGSKRRREGKQPESTSAPKEKATRTTGKSTQGIQPWISKLAKQTDSRSSFNELMDTPVDFSAFLINRLKVDTLTPELLAGPTYELMKGSCKSLELEFFLEKVYKATTDQLDWINPEGQQYPHNLLKPLPLIPNTRGRLVIPFNHFINNDLEYLRGGASSRKYIASVTKTKVANYGHIKWIKDLMPCIMWIQEPEGDFKRLCIQDIEDMLLLLVQGKLTNLTVKKCFVFNVSPRVFTRSIVIQRRVEDLQLGVESYQKKLNLTRPDMYRSDLKRKEAYTAYSIPREIIYQNKGKQNRLMWIDELYKFSNGMLNDVRTALDDRLKGIRMKYLPQTIWRKSDKERVATIIQAIDKQLETRRIMRNQGSKRRREGKELESASAPKEKATRIAGKSTQGSKSRQTSAISTQSAQASPLIPNSRGRRVILFDHFINNDLEYLCGGALSRKYTTSVTKTKAADYGHIKWIEDLVPRTMWIQELNKDKQNRLMRIDELHKFSDGTLTDVCTTLDDRLKGIRMKYLLLTIWMKSDKKRAAAMIQAIDKKLKTRRIMRSLKRFVGGRLYEGNFRMLQRTI